MTPKRLAFAREWLIDFNGGQAAIRAGFSEKGASTTATRLLSNPKVQVEIARLAAIREEKLDLSADRTLLEIARIAFADIRNVVEWITHGVGTVDLPDPEDPEGEPITLEIGHSQVRLKDSKKLDADTAAAISEIRQNKDGALVVKMHSKPQALDLLARHHGLIIDRKQVDFRVMVGTMTDEQLSEYRHQLAERLRGGSAGRHLARGGDQTIDGKRSIELRPAAKTG